MFSLRKVFFNNVEDFFFFLFAEIIVLVNIAILSVTENDSKYEFSLSYYKKAITKKRLQIAIC
jgi:hypothetical protein